MAQKTRSAHWYIILSSLGETGFEDCPPSRSEDFYLTSRGIPESQQDSLPEVFRAQQAGLNELGFSLRHVSDWFCSIIEAWWLLHNEDSSWATGVATVDENVMYVSIHVGMKSWA
jgi:hypothetical protein